MKDNEFRLKKKVTLICCHSLRHFPKSLNVSYSLNLKSFHLADRYSFEWDLWSIYINFICFDHSEIAKNSFYLFSPMNYCLESLHFLIIALIFDFKMFWFRWWYHLTVRFRSWWHKIFVLLLVSPFSFQIKNLHLYFSFWYFHWLILTLTINFSIINPA